MKKKEWLLVLAPLFFTWGLDRLTKVWAQTITQVYHYGPLVITFKKNPGVMLGLFSDLPAIIRVVCLSTGGAFLFFSYVVIQYLLPIKSLILRAGLSILLGGILGNVTDRILWGYVVDFLIIGNEQISTAVFNVADAVQWIAYFMICYSLIRESEILWPENNQRNSLWINPRYQIKYCLILISAGLGFSVISGTFSYTFLKVALTDWNTRATSSVNHLMTSFIITFTIVSFIFALMLLLLGRRLSHRTVGPIYAFEKYLEDLLAGKTRKLKFRTGDEFTHLEDLANRIRAHLDTVKDKKEPPNLEKFGN